MELCYRCVCVLGGGLVPQSFGFLFLFPSILPNPLALQTTTVGLVLPQRGSSNSPNKPVPSQEAGTQCLPGTVGRKNSVKGRARGRKSYVERIYERRHKPHLFSFFLSPLLCTCVWKLNL